MKVAHIISSFSALTETFIYDYVTELENQGHECHVFAHDLLNQEQRPFGNVHHVPRIQRWDSDRALYRIAHGLGLGREANATWEAYSRRFAKAIGGVGPDVVHAHFGQMGAAVSSLPDRLGVPMIVSFHGRDAFAAPRSPLYREAYGRLFERAAALTVVSHLMADHLVSLGADRNKVHVVRVGKRVDEYPQQESPGGQVREWVSVGRLVEKKGYLDALAAFAGVVGDHPDQRLRIVGEGPLRDEMNTFIDQNGLSGHVDLVGNLGHDEVKALLSAADAFVLCSRTGPDGDREGVPTVLMEAQLVGLPCVSTTHSGIPEVIPEQNRWLLSPEGDVASIERAMRALIASDLPKRREIARAGRRKVEAEFGLVTEVGKLSRLYASVRSGR